MPASLQNFSDNRQTNPNSERLVQCPHCPQKYLLVWDDREWNSVKGWIRIAETAVRKSHRTHGEIALPPTRKVLAKT
jgi:hypothetical protein